MQPNIEPNLHFLEWRIFLLFALGTMIENTLQGVENRSKKNIFTVFSWILSTFSVIFADFGQNDVTSGARSTNSRRYMPSFIGVSNNFRSISFRCASDIWNSFQLPIFPEARSLHMFCQQKQHVFPKDCKHDLAPLNAISARNLGPTFRKIHSFRVDRYRNY